MKVTTLGIDLAKSTFRVHGVDGRGTVMLRRQLTRKQLLPVLANLPACLVGMEACAGADYWAREIEKLGHTVRLMSPHFVGRSQEPKERWQDAAAICEAVGVLQCGSCRSRVQPSKTSKRCIEFASSSSGARLRPMKSAACLASTELWLPRVSDLAQTADADT
jgi:transposase